MPKQTRCLAALLAAVGLWAALLCPALAGERVEDPAGLFSFVPPEGWTVSMVHSTKESQVRADLAGQHAFLTVAARPIPQGITWESWKEAILQGARQSLDQIKAGPYRLCGAQALALVGRSRESGDETVELVAADLEGVGLVLTMTYPSRLWRSFRPALEQVLLSFSCRQGQ